MFAFRASGDRPLTTRASTLSSGAMWLRDSWIARDARWLAGLSLVYALAVIGAVLTLNPYFSQTWDVVTFAHAARSFLSGADWAGLYAQSRIERFWPYAYPPLHALVIAPLLAIGGAMPDWLWARVPPLLADLGIGLLLYSMVARRAREQTLARLALVVWLLNPVTFYDTAVQGHFEAEWLFFVLLAYLLAESRRGMVPPTLALACAFLFKQTAIIFAIPYWLWLIASPGLVHQHDKAADSELYLPPRLIDVGRRVTPQVHFGALLVGDLPYRPTVLKRLVPAAASVALFTAAVLLGSLPFLLYSGDYLYMNLQYVAQVPLQTQSWLVALGGIFGPDFLLLRYSSLLVLLASVLISGFTLRRGANLYLIAVLITLSFFLLSKKVVGYYYVMSLPFALIAFLPARRFGLLALWVASSAWISLSPYFASWANPDHLPFYAALGTLNSLFYLGLFIYLWRDLTSPLLQQSKNSREPYRKERGTRRGTAWPDASEGEGQGEVVSSRTLMFVSVALFLEAVAAAGLQPLVDNPTSPIRAPIIPPGLGSNVLLASVAFVVILLAAFIFSLALTRGRARIVSLPLGALGALALVFAPLYFLTFTLTKESTAFVEIALKSLGL